MTWASPVSPFAPRPGHGPLIAFERVTATLGAGPRALDDVTLAIPAGGLTAVVGGPEVAKAMLFGLLLRRHEATAGAILLDGRPLEAIPQPELAQAVAAVERDAPVRSRTLREHLRGAAPSASAGELAAVLAEARLEVLLERLPDGLDSELADSSALPCGGERQRIAIARALLRRPRVLLLDETTAPLDPPDAHALRATIARAAARCTVLAIAHRLSTVEAAERVVVLDEGRVHACGTHDALLGSDARYRELVATRLVAQRTG